MLDVHRAFNVLCIKFCPKFVGRFIALYITACFIIDTKQTLALKWIFQIKRLISILNYQHFKISSSTTRYNRFGACYPRFAFALSLSIVLFPYDPNVHQLNNEVRRMCVYALFFYYYYYVAYIM